MEKQLAEGDAGSVATGDAKAGLRCCTGVPVGAFFFSRSAAIDSDARRWKSMAAARKRSDALGPAGLEEEGFEAKRAAAVALASAARRFMRCIVVSFGGGAGGAWSSSSDSWPLMSSVDGTLGGITGEVGGVWSVSSDENWGDTPSGGTGEFRRLTSARAAAGSSGSAGGGAVALEPLATVVTRAPASVRSYVLAAGSGCGEV